MNIVDMNHAQFKVKEVRKPSITIFLKKAGQILKASTLRV